MWALLKCSAARRVNFRDIGIVMKWNRNIVEIARSVLMHSPCRTFSSHNRRMRATPRPVHLERWVSGWNRLKEHAVGMQTILVNSWASNASKAPAKNPLRLMDTHEQLSEQVALCPIRHHLRLKRFCLKMYLSNGPCRDFDFEDFRNLFAWN